MDDIKMFGNRDTWHQHEQFQEKNIDLTDPTFETSLSGLHPTRSRSCREAVQSKPGLFRRITTTEVTNKTGYCEHPLPRTSQDSTSSVRKFNLESSQDMHCVRRGIWQEIVGRRHRGAGKLGRVRNSCSETQCEGSLHAEKS